MTTHHPPRGRHTNHIEAVRQTVWKAGEGISGEVGSRGAIWITTIQWWKPSLPQKPKPLAADLPVFLSPRVSLSLSLFPKPPLDSRHGCCCSSCGSYPYFVSSYGSLSDCLFVDLSRVLFLSLFMVFCRLLMQIRVWLISVAYFGSGFYVYFVEVPSLLRLCLISLV